MALFGNPIPNTGREGLILSVHNGIAGEVGFFFLVVMWTLLRNLDKWFHAVQFRSALRVE